MKNLNILIGLLLFCNVVSIGLAIHQLQSYPVPEIMLWVNLIGCVAYGFWLNRPIDIGY